MTVAPSPVVPSGCDAQYRCATSFLRFGSSEVGVEGRAVVESGVEGERESRYAEERGCCEDRAFEGGVLGAGVRAALS